jgi:hypothetical protein
MLRLPMVRLTVSKAVTGGSNPPRSAMHRKPMASAPAATRWNADRFRGGAPMEGAKRRQRLLVPKTRAPQGWRFDSSALRQYSVGDSMLSITKMKKAKGDGMRATTKNRRFLKAREATES